MTEIHIMKMKITEVEMLSSVTIGRSLMKGIHSNVKYNQAFGQENADDSIHLPSTGKLNDADLKDSNRKHDTYPL